MKKIVLTVASITMMTISATASLVAYKCMNSVSELAKLNIEALAENETTLNNYYNWETKCNYCDGYVVSCLWDESGANNPCTVGRCDGCDRPGAFYVR